MMKENICAAQYGGQICMLNFTTTLEFELLDSPSTISPSVFQTPAKFTKLTPTTPLGPKPILFSPTEVTILFYIV